jgi:uncharacterized protein with von Willebrand factor type A (vWA) domain
MLIGLFNAVRAAGVPVSLRELLDLHGALQAHLAFADQEQFYELTRLLWVKDERHYDRFDQAFGAWWQGVESQPLAPDGVIPEEWLRRDFLRQLSDEDKAAIEKLGGLDALMKAFRNVLPNRRSATPAATSGSAPAAPAPSVREAITRKAYAWAKAATAARSRYGTSASFAAWPTTRS